MKYSSCLGPAHLQKSKKPGQHTKKRILKLKEYSEEKWKRKYVLEYFPVANQIQKLDLSDSRIILICVYLAELVVSFNDL